MQADLSSPMESPYERPSGAVENNHTDETYYKMLSLETWKNYLEIIHLRVAELKIYHPN